MRKLIVQAEGDNQVVVTRRFSASPEALYRAHTEPDLIRQWMLGPGDWTMPVCLCDAWPGGSMRFEFSDGKGGGFYLTGEFVSLEPFSRIEHVERVHAPGASPDNYIETTFTPDGAETLLQVRTTLPCEEARDAMLASPMERGLGAGYARLDSITQIG